ncbi:MAG TPA: hypothetical protein PL033_15160 [Candidatus Brocadiia bacterium]|nr:hypothetical protein [Candidatus Brocadiia bacterium]
MVSTVCVLLAGCASSGGRDDAPAAQIPFPEALTDADIRVESLNSILDDALLIGNGDVNALVWTQGSDAALMLTKNDVWDARVDMSNEPPLPTLARVTELGRSGQQIGNYVLPEGSAWSGKDSYHSHPYPCPRACAKITLGADSPVAEWRRIRAEGDVNEWRREGGAAVMTIKGRKEASNGYAFAPLKLNTRDFQKLRVRISGTENAQFFVDVMDQDGKVVIGSKWIETPTTPEDRVFELPPDREIGSVILYTWTEDGATAQNRFEALTFEGGNANFAVDMSLPEPPKRRGLLDLSKAVATIEGPPNGPGGAEIRALAGRNVLLIKSAETLRIHALPSPDLPPAEEGETDGARWIRQAIPGDLDWPGMEFAVAAAESGSVKAVATVTSIEAKDIVREAVRLAKSTVAEDDARLIREHEADWRDFWSKSGIVIPDETLQRTWYRSLYFLRCVSRPGCLSPGLFAGLINDTPAWHGDYHTNYNIQQTFWAAFAANHLELVEPYNRLIKEYLPRAKWLSEQVFAMKGAYYPHVIFAYEPPDPAACKSAVGRQYIHHVWGMTLGVTGFTVQPVWWHYKYAPDRDFLMNVAYPLVKEVALFYAEFIEKCEGGVDAVRFGPSVSPEHWGWTRGLDRNYNCAFDIAMARYILNAAIEGAGILGCDAKLVERFKAAEKRLPPYPLGEADGLPIIVDVEGAPPINYNIAVPATPVFPCDVVTWRSPVEEMILFTSTIGRLEWNGNNSTVMLGVARARLNMHDAQEWIRNEIKARLRPNGTLTLNRLDPRHHFNDFGHYTEQFGAGMAVTELLVQSVGDVIRVLPALDSGGEARFANLRTQGGFLVSGSGTARSVGPLTIESTAGGPLRLLSPWGEAEIVAADGSVQIAKPDADGIITIQTRAGEKLILRAVGEQNP